MKNSSIKLGAAALILALTSACSTTTHELNRDFADDLIRYGENPLIKSPVMKNLEQRIRDIVLAPDQTGTPYGLEFNPRNQAILDNFKDQYDHSAMMKDINLARAGFDAAASSYYPTIGDITTCGIADEPGYFPNADNETTSVTWQFIKGDCHKGLAQGIATANATQSDAQFIGRFDRGVMIEGVYTILRNDGTRVIQIGAVPTKNRAARLLRTGLNKNGYQWHQYGDFNHQGGFDGFGVNIWGYTNKMLVRSVGHFSDNKLNGFGAEQLLRNYQDGKLYKTWIGTYAGNKLNGVGAWTNGVDRIIVSEWSEGKIHGIGYEEYKPFGVLYHEYSVGPYINGNEHGWFTVQTINVRDTVRLERKRYDKGSVVEIDDESSDFDFGQIVALAAGAAVIGSSPIDSVSKAEIGGAFMADVLGDANESSMQILQEEYQTQHHESLSNKSKSINESKRSPRGAQEPLANRTKPKSQVATNETPTDQAENPINSTAGTTSTQNSSTTDRSNNRVTNGTSDRSANRTAATHVQSPPGAARVSSTLPAQQPASKKEKLNSYAGSGRDYPFTGASEQFYKRELAVKLARINLMNQASEFCGSGLKTEILWSAQPSCKPSASEKDNFKCSIDGLVNCYENFCEEAFCGTAAE